MSENARSKRYKLRELPANEKIVALVVAILNVVLPAARAWLARQPAWVQILADVAFVVVLTLLGTYGVSRAL